MFSQLLDGFMFVLSVKSILLTSGGVALGILFGAIPGLTPGMAIALCLPITFSMDPMSSMCLLVGLYIGGVSGGLISAILINIPGTPASIATTFDGRPMALNGQAGKAMAAGIIFSFLGSIFSIIVLVLIAPQLSEIAINFTPFDYFSVILFSLTIMIGLSGHSVIKGLISGMLGMSFALVGASPIDGIPRFTMGLHELDGGFDFLPVMIGIFAITQIFSAAEESSSPHRAQKILAGIGRVHLSFKEFTGQFGNFLYASTIGTVIGILPGIGGGTSNLVSYSAVRRISKHPEKFGTGILDGIVASEAANNASIGGAMVPLLSLGIPGDAVTAILIGAFMIQGISPGPLMFMTEMKLVNAIFAALISASFFMVIIEFIFLRGFIKLLDIPKEILLPCIFGICTIGAFAVNNRIFGVWTMLILGVIAFIMSKFDYPLPPMIMGFVLGPLLETNLRRGLIVSHGSFTPFFTEPISGVMLVITLITLSYSVYKNISKMRNAIDA